MLFRLSFARTHIRGRALTSGSRKQLNFPSITSAHAADAGRVVRQEKEEFDVRWEHPVRRREPVTQLVRE